MERLVKKWFEYAKVDLEAAEILANSPKSHYSYQLSVLHCHQAIEKIIKTVIVSQKKEPKRVHNLIYLLQESNLELPIELRKYIGGIKSSLSTISLSRYSL